MNRIQRDELKVIEYLAINEYWYFTIGMSFYKRRKIARKLMRNGAKL